MIFPIGSDSEFDHFCIWEEPLLDESSEQRWTAVSDNMWFFEKEKKKNNNMKAV